MKNVEWNYFSWWKCLSIMAKKGFEWQITHVKFQAAIGVGGGTMFCMK